MQIHNQINMYSPIIVIQLYSYNLITAYLLTLFQVSFLIININKQTNIPALEFVQQPPINNHLTQIKRIIRMSTTLSLHKYANQSFTPHLSQTQSLNYVQSSYSSSYMSSANLPIVIKNKSCKMYFLVDDRNKIYFNADFDSGNIQKIQQLAPYEFKLYPGLDKTRQSTQKTFFHFKVFGFKLCIANFVIANMKILQKLITPLNSKSTQKITNPISTVYHPVFRTSSNNQFSKVQSEVKLYFNALDQPQLSFHHQFINELWVQFAFSFPYSYQDNQQLVQQLRLKYENHQNVYFKDQILCLSKEKRNIHLLTISDKSNCLEQMQSKINETLLNQDSQLDRPLKIDRHVIFMTARVHPGETPASYCMDGALRFILNQNDFRSYLLRRHFLILVVPMLNPDGVYNGMFRSDMQGQNLNRVYLNSNRQQHPTIFAVTKLAQWIKKQKQVLFFFDFHAHPTTKNFFIYGNSFNQISRQVQAQLFGKLIEVNCPYFQNLQSIYEEREMNMKQKNQKYSKEGCARVYMHKIFNVIHSYTVECGYFTAKKVSNNYSQAFFEDQDDNSYSPFKQTKQWQQVQTKQYTPNCYRLMGKSILITVLDILGLNPYQKKFKGEKKQLQAIRKSYGLKIYHQVQKFRLLDSNIYKKLSDLTKLIQQSYYGPKLQRFNNLNYNLFDITNQEKTKQTFRRFIVDKNQNSNKNLLKSNSFVSANLTLVSKSKLSKYEKVESCPVLNIPFKIQRQNQKVYEKPKLRMQKQKIHKYQNLLKRGDNLEIISNSNSKSSPHKRQQSQKKVSFKVAICSTQILKFTNVDVSKVNQTYSMAKSNYIQNLMKRQNDLEKVQEHKEKAQQLLLKRINQNSQKYVLNSHSLSSSVQSSNLNSAINTINLQYKKGRSISKQHIQFPISRKNSLNKLIYVKKDQLKLMKLSNLISFSDNSFGNFARRQKNKQPTSSIQLFNKLEQVVTQTQKYKQTEEIYRQNQFINQKQRQKHKQLLPQIKDARFQQTYKKKFVVNYGKNK